MKIGVSYYMKGLIEMVTEELIRRAQGGDFDAMEELLEQTEDFIFSFVQTHIENQADADDVAMLAMEAIWQYLPKSAPIRRYDAWVSKIVWNKINGYYRKGQRNKLIPMSDIFHDGDRGLDHDEIEEFGIPKFEEIRYSPEARRELEEAEKAFRGD